mgnify:CR=1 FL=1
MPKTTLITFSCIDDRTKAISILEGIGEQFACSIGSWFLHDPTPEGFPLTLKLESKTAWKWFWEKMWEANFNIVVRMFGN